MAINNKIKQLYDALKSDGGDVGTEQEFNDWFLKPGAEGYRNRKEVYDVFKADGADIGKDYEEFAGWLDLQPTKANMPAVEGAGGSVTTSASAPAASSVTTPEAPVNAGIQTKPTTPQAVGKNDPKAGREFWFNLRRGGKDFKVSASEVNGYGGLQEWVKYHPGAPVRVYMQDGKTKQKMHVDLSEAAKRRQQNGYLYDGEWREDRKWSDIPAEAKGASLAHLRDTQKKTLTSLEQAKDNAVRRLGSETPEGRKRTRDAEFKAKALGADTHLMGLNRGVEPTESGAKADRSGGVVMSPKVHDVVMVDGRPTVEWMLPDGSMTTDRLAADQAEYAARQSRMRHDREQKMKQNDLDPTKQEDVEKQATIDAIVSGAIEDPAKREEIAKAFEENGLDINNAEHVRWLVTGANRKILEYRLTKAEARLESLVEEKQHFKDSMGAIDHPLPAGAVRTPGMSTATPYDKDIENAQAEVLAIERSIRDYDNNTTASKQNSLLQPFVGLWNGIKDPNSWTSGILNLSIGDAVQKADPNSETGRSLLNAYSMGEQLRAKAPETSGLYSGGHFVGEMLGDPITYVSSGLGGVAKSVVSKAIAGQIGKGMSKEIAERLAVNSLGNRLISAGVGSGVNLFAFEGLRDLRQQATDGGWTDSNGKFHEGLSWYHAIKQGGHGLGLGIAMGVFGAGFGNVGDVLVKGVKGTGIGAAVGKAGVRVSQHVASVGSEASIFAMPEIIEFHTMDDDKFDRLYAEKYGYAEERDEAKRNEARDKARNSLSWDAWSDSGAMVAGMKIAGKVTHPVKTVKSVSQTLRDLKSKDQREHTTMAERISRMMERSPLDVALTKEEREELRAAGYGKLGDLFRKSDNKVGVQNEDGSWSETGTSEKGKARYGRDGKTVEGFNVREELTGYDLMEEFMNDSRVSESARAKAYYILTGHMLPMSTVVASERVKNEDGTITVCSLNKDGGVVTSRCFKTNRGARGEEDKIDRQAELNMVDIMERYMNTVADENVFLSSIKEVAPDADPGAIKAIYDRAKNGEVVGAEYEQLVKDIDAALEANEDAGYRPEHLRAEIEAATGIKIDEVLRKTREKRSGAEQEMLTGYVDRMMRMGESHSHAAPGREASAGNSDLPALRNGDAAEERGSSDEGAVSVPESAEERESAVRSKRYQERRMQETLGDDYASVMDLLDKAGQGNGGGMPEELTRRDGTPLNSQERAVIADYQKSQEVVAAIYQRMEAEQRAAIERQHERIDKASHEDGNLRPATMKDGDRQVYIVKGNVVLTDDGTMINMSASDKVIYLYDPAKDKVEQSSPDQLAKLGDVTSVSWARSEMERMIMSSTISQMRAMNGVREEFGVGERVIVDFGNGPEQFTITEATPTGELVLQTEGAEGRYSITPAMLSRYIDDYKQSVFESKSVGDAEITGDAQTPSATDASMADHSEVVEKPVRSEMGYEQGDSFRVMVSGSDKTQHCAVVDREGDVVTIWTPFAVNERSEKSRTMAGYTTDIARENLEAIMERDAQGQPVDYVSVSPKEETVPEAETEVKPGQKAGAETGLAENGGAGSLGYAEKDVTSQYGERTGQDNAEYPANDGGRMAPDPAESVEGDRDRSDIRVYEEGLASHQTEHSQYSERARRDAEAERLISIARQNGQYFDHDKKASLGTRHPKRTGESEVYENKDENVIYKIKNPYAKSPMKGDVQPEDAIYEHLVHNKYFPETRYRFEGISDDMGDARIVLSQDYVESVGQPSAEQIEAALAEKGLVREGKYSFGNDEITVTDVTGDNALLGADGKVYFIDPIINFKKPVREILGDKPGSAAVSSEREAQGEAVEAMPMRAVTERGETWEEPDYLATTPERSHNYIYKESGLTREEADEHVVHMAKAARQAVSKHSNKAPKVGGSIARYQREKAAWEQTGVELQRAVEFWDAVKAEQKRITDADRAEREAIEAQDRAERQRRYDEVIRREQEAEQAKQDALRQERERQEAEREANAAEMERERQLPYNQEKARMSNNFEEYFEAERQKIITSGMNERRQQLDERIRNARGGKQYGDIYNALSEDGGSVGSLEEWVTRALSLGGRRVKWNGDGNLRGQIFATKPGTKVSEVKELQWMISDKDGLPFWDFVHKLWESVIADDTLGFNRADITDQDVRNVVIETLRMHPTSRSLFESAIAMYDRRSASESARGELDEMDHYMDDIRDEWYRNNYGLSYEEYNQRVETIYNELERSELSDADVEEINSQITEEETERLNRHGYERDNERALRISTADLQAKQSDQRTGTETAAGIGSEASGRRGDSESGTVSAEERVEPSEAQKAAGNYKMEHRRIDGYNISIENAKGSVRRGTGADGKPWETVMQNDYGYIRGTEGVDGDHIDVFLSDTPEEGDVFVVDQVNENGSFDEHKVMYGFPTEQAAREAYLSNYEPGWTGLGAITRVSKEEFKKWIQSSRRKTKPFADYANIKKSASASSQHSVAEYKSVKTIKGNGMIGRSLTEQEATELIERMEATAEVAPSIELTPENWIAQFGEDGTVETPIGIVKMGENQYFKMARQGREGKLGMVKPTLQKPDIVIEDYRPASNKESERDTSYIFVKTFSKEDGSRYYYFTSVTVRKEGREVVISNQERSDKRISKLLQQGKIAWIGSGTLHPKSQVGKPVSLNDSSNPTNSDNGTARLGINSSANGKNLSPSSEMRLTEAPSESEGPDLVPTSDNVISESKGNALYSDKQGDAGESLGMSAKAAGQEAKTETNNANRIDRTDKSDGRRRPVMHHGAEAEANRAVYEAGKGLLESAGIKVHEVSDAEAEAMLGNKNTPFAGQPNRANEKLTSGSVLLSISGNSSSNRAASKEADTKLQNKTLRAKNKIAKFRNGDYSVSTETLDKAMAGIGKMFAMDTKGGTRYTVLKAENGDTIALRLGDHAANGNNFARDNADQNVSIVIERKRYDTPDSEIEFTEATISEATFKERPQEVVNAIVDGVDGLLRGDEFTLDESIGTVERKGEYGREEFTNFLSNRKPQQNKSVENTQSSAHRSNAEVSDARIEQKFQIGHSESEASSRENSAARLRELDRQYLAAVERGDMEAAQKMVNEAAERSGYSADSDYQGTSAFNGAAPCNGYGWSKAERKELWDKDEFEGDWTLGDQIDGMGTDHLDFMLFDPNGERSLSEFGRESARALREAYRNPERKITVYRSVPSDVKEGALRDGDWVTPSRSYAKDNAAVHGWERKYRIIEQEVDVDELWWDGNDINEWGYDSGSNMGYRNTKNNRKLLDAVTYDDNGNVIPLSKRFDSRKSDARYLRTAEGRVYGWTVDGEIYLNRDAMNPETPVHEYTHLWDEMVKQENPELWERGKELMKQTLVWDEVMSDPNYADIRGDEDAVASEVHARLTGRHGSKLMQEMIDKAKKQGVIETAKAVNLIENLKSWFAEMFNALKKTLSKWSKRDLEELTVEDFNRMTMRDMTEGLNPRSGDKNLVAVHNMSEAKLMDALDLGGLPMPSIAITKANMGHGEFGEISLVFGHESIDPTDRRNKVYGGDAWTPMFPSIGYKLNDAKTAEIYSRARAAGNLPFLNPVHFYPDNYERRIEGTETDNLVEVFKDDFGAKQLYLSEQGRAVEKMIEHNVEKYTPRQIEIYEALLKDIGQERLSNESRETLEPEVKRVMAKFRNVDNMKPFLLRSLLSNSIHKALDYAENGNLRTEGDIAATQEEINRRIDNADYREWLEKLFEGVVEKRGIRNERDRFTPSGSARKWETLYDAVTLDNVVKAMQRQAAKGGNGLFGGNLFGAAAKGFRDIEELRNDAERRIKSMPEAGYQEAKKEIEKRLESLSERAGFKGFEAQMNFEENVRDAVAKSDNARAIYNHLRRFYPEMRFETAEEIAGIVHDIQELSTRYFEAKPQRAVGFEEVKLAVVPDGTSDDIVRRLEDMGIPVKTYERGNESQRQAVISRETSQMGLRFHVAMAHGGEEFDAIEERTLKLSVMLADRHNGDVAVRDAAIEALGKKIGDIRKAMGAQRTYDFNTVRSLRSVAEILMTSGTFKPEGVGEVKRLMSIINKGVGHAYTDKDGVEHVAQSEKDYNAAVDGLMDLFVDNQLKVAGKFLDEVMKIRGSKVNARGVEVMGALDAEGQVMVRSMKEYMGMDKQSIRDRIDTLDEIITTGNDAAATNAAAEKMGVELAEQYVSEVSDRVAQEKMMRDQLRDMTSQWDASMSGDVRKAYIEQKRALRESICKIRIERADAMRQLASEVGNELRNSIERVKAFREREKQRIEEIWHNANSDMTGRAFDEHGMKKKGLGVKLSNNMVSRLLLAPAATFEQVMRVFGSKSINGEGYLFDRFVRGWQECRDKEWTSTQEVEGILNSKAAEILGKRNARWCDLYSLSRKDAGTCDWWDGGQIREHKVTQGNLMYMYMTNKMTDGQVKLRRMCITDDKMLEIERSLDPRLKAVADWLQEELLPNLRNKYNEVHERMFGAPMAEIGNYFPLKILANARLEEVEMAGKIDGKDLPKTMTGAIIKRRFNNYALDVLNSDAVSVALDHIREMETWAAFAEYRRDLCTLLSYKHFRNQVKNMTTIYGSGEKFWNKFYDLSLLVGGAYQPKTSEFDKSMVNATKLATGACIAIRLNTALKQLLSYPAFAPEANIARLMYNMTPWRARSCWKWAMENMPSFKRRWMSRQAGNDVLKEWEHDWDWTRTEFVQKVQRAGITPNAFIDALTVSMGSEAVFHNKLKYYLKDGFSKEEAHRRAIQDAEITFNLSQQSSELPYLSLLQNDRSYLTTCITNFRNSPMSYLRQSIQSKRELINMIKSKGVMMEFETKKGVREGLTPEQAEVRAKRKYRRNFARNMFKSATFDFILPALWAFGLTGAWYCIFGDDDEKKKQYVEDSIKRGLFGAFEGLTGGGTLPDFMYGLATDTRPQLDEETSPAMGLLTDLANLYSNGKTERAANEMINTMVALGVGVNPQVVEDAVVAGMDFFGQDEKNARDYALFAMRVLSCPQSQMDQVYFDELGMNAREAQRMSPSQLAERYATYKVRRSNFATVWSMSDEELAKAKEPLLKRFEKEAKARLNGQSEERINTSLESYDAEWSETGEQLKALSKGSGDVVEKAEQAQALYDSPAGVRYRLYKELHPYLDKMIKSWLMAPTGEAAATEAVAILDYKIKIVEMLDAWENEEKSWKLRDEAKQIYYEWYDRNNPQ